MQQQTQHIQLIPKLSNDIQTVQSDIHTMKSSFGKDILDLREDLGKVKSDTIKIIEQNRKDDKADFESYKEYVQTQFDQLNSKSTTNEVPDREITVIDKESPPPSVLHQDGNRFPKQYLSQELSSYMQESYENVKS